MGQDSIDPAILRQQVSAVSTEYLRLAIYSSPQWGVRKVQRTQFGVDQDKFRLAIPASHLHRPSRLCEHLPSWDWGNALGSACTVAPGSGANSSSIMLLSLKFQITDSISPRWRSSHGEEENGLNRFTSMWPNLTYSMFGFSLENQQTVTAKLVFDLVAPSRLYCDFKQRFKWY